MSEYFIQHSTITDIAEAIRNKTGKTDLLSTDEIIAEIANIETGVDTSDATAVAEDVLSGKTAYVDGEKITGTIVTKSSNDLSSSGATVTVPAGYYASDAIKSIATATRANTTISTTADDTNDKLTITASNNQSTGYVTGANKTATTTITLTASGATVTASDGTNKVTKSVATATQATPSISIDSAGKITASATQTAGYVSAGTKSGTKQLTTQAAKTVTPSSSVQTAVNSGVYTTGAIKVAAIASSYTHLNFTVVGGTSQPSNPAANTIWVNTSTSITDYVFKPTQPTGANGRVWIQTKISGSAEFNALKSNWIYIYPASCKQYINNAWVTKTAKSYIGGKWVEWSPSNALYWLGDECANITGGWVSAGTTSTKSAYATGGTVTKSGDMLKIDGITDGLSNSLRTVNKIDLTNVNTIYFQVYSASTKGAYTFSICSNTTHISSNATSMVEKMDTSISGTLIALDVSSYSGSYYIAFGLRTSGDSGTMHLYVSKVYTE